ncbi:MAG TPA: SPFH domain-containing protein [Candidatus Acidoferrales bacterium]|jgi:uncharacterized membrane protein YqiK|nr:SPFH domain-containing protein [Candidatus Acidoferrales bacterium]
MTPDAYWHFLASYWWILLLVMVVLLERQIMRLFGVVLIPQSSVGIVDKRYALVGKNRTLAEGQIVALNGEAGIQADTLAPGLHFFLWPWQYSIKLQDFLVVPQDSIGVVEARGGTPLIEGRVLGKKVECKAFQDARAFLQGGGQRGPQITIIPPGTYRINTSVFSVNTSKVLEIPVNAVGVVTIKDGRPLNTGEIAGPEVKDHNSFQDAQAFIDAGGYKGLQEQVILAGRYFINPMFATVEIKPMTAIPIANVGVVIAYVGEPGKDVTGDAFKHGNIVGKGEKGVWNDPLDPGMYPINPYTIRVELVPTANVVLNWADGKSEAHNLDKDLSTITVRSSDGFKFNLDVSQIIHIPRADAPKVIARFGSMVNLVTQVLEPTIGNYFRNAAQNSDVIDFLKNRQTRQADARKSISDALQEYNVGAVDTLIGDITPPEELMKTLTDRKIADQRKVTFDSQRLAEDNRRELEKSKAMADTQASIVTAERSVTIAGFAADATIKQAEGQARAKTVNAEADATVTKVTGDADAGKTLAVGTAEADVIKLKIASMTSDNYAVIETAKALASSGFKLVPDIVASGDGGGTNSLMNVFLARLIKDSNGTSSAKT